MSTMETTAPRKITRESRRPFGMQVQKLAYEARPGYHRHWFNETPGRLEAAVAAGYTYVLDKEGKKVKRVVGVDNAGAPQQAYLLEIPDEWYKEDMQRTLDPVQEMENAIREGKGVSGNPGDDSTQYVPKDRGITIKRGGRPS